MTNLLREKVRGRWHEVLPALGISPKDLTGKHGPCPICSGGKDRFRFDDKDGAGTWICSQCGAGDGFALVQKHRSWDFRTAARMIGPLVGYDETPHPPATARRDDSILRENQKALWESSKAIRYGSVVARYLDGRGFKLERYPEALREVEELAWYDKGKNGLARMFPAMVARVTAPDGTTCGLHRTWLAVDGSGKAPVPDARRLMPGKLTKGCAVRLGLIGDESRPPDVLGVAEGIETAMAASIMFGVQVHATLSAGLMMSWQAPGGIKRVVVFGDNDGKFVGQTAAYSLAQRLVCQCQIDARVMIPDRMGQDWNDVLLEKYGPRR